jgi:hypothetical protein
MQLRIAFALAIYLGSYLPLGLILLAQDLSVDVVLQGICPVRSMIALDCTSPLKNGTVSMSFAVACIVGLLATLFALRSLPTPHRIKVTESKHIPADLIAYVIPYAVSFVGLDLKDIPKLIGFAVFLGWLFWITYKSGQIALNPVLAVLGWRLYEVKYSFPGSGDILVGRMLSRIDIEPAQSYRQGWLQDVMVVRSNNAEGGT